MKFDLNLIDTCTFFAVALLLHDVSWSDIYVPNIVTTLGRGKKNAFPDYILSFKLHYIDKNKFVFS